MGISKYGGQAAMSIIDHAIVRINKIDPDKPFVALTFDDGPSEHTTHILDTLHQYGARASFFVSGKNVSEHEGKILRASHMGCEVISHSWDHINMTTLSSRAIKKQLFESVAAIAKVTGKVSLMFRPPYGSINKRVEKVALKLGLAIVNWSLDPNDWDTKDADAIYTYIANNVKNGDIILCHDVYDSTAEAMSRLIPELVERECQLVTVSELLLHVHKEIEPGKLYMC